jgi:hypothetical protein
MILAVGPSLCLMYNYSAGIFALTECYFQFSPRVNTAPEISFKIIVVTPCYCLSSNSRFSVGGYDWIAAELLRIYISRISPEIITLRKVVKEINTFSVPPRGYRRLTK